MKPHDGRRIFGYRAQWHETGSLWSEGQERKLARAVQRDLEGAFGLPELEPVNPMTDMDIDPGWPYSRNNELAVVRRGDQEKRALQYEERKRARARRDASELAEKRARAFAEEQYDRRKAAVASTNPLRVVGCALDLPDFVAMLTGSGRR